MYRSVWYSVGIAALYGYFTYRLRTAYAPALANNHKSQRFIAMKKSLLALSLLSALTLSAAASAAEGVSYNYVEGGYTATNLKDAPDSDGWGLNGSVAIAPN